jgi:hypothetical protein
MNSGSHAEFLPERVHERDILALKQQIKPAVRIMLSTVPIVA